DARQPASPVELADVPAAVHQRRADRRLRHHHRALRDRPTRPDVEGSTAGGGAEGVSATASGAPAVTAAGALAGRVVLVAGAHGGLGAAASLACARAGATVVLLGRKVPKLTRLGDALAAEGPEPLLYPLDLEGASPDDYAELAARIE